MDKGIILQLVSSVDYPLALNQSDVIMTQFSKIAMYAQVAHNRWFFTSLLKNAGAKFLHPTNCDKILP
jgi:hypothetical protein